MYLLNFNLTDIYNFYFIIYTIIMISRDKKIMASLYVVGNMTYKCVQGNRIFFDQPKLLKSKSLNNVKVNKW